MKMLKLQYSCFFSKKVEKRSEVVAAFIAVFQLTDAESAALRGGTNKAAGDIDENFFAALKRVKQIHADCKQMLRYGQHVATYVSAGGGYSFDLRLVFQFGNNGKYGRSSGVRIRTALSLDST
jgi:hypothetical protein